MSQAAQFNKTLVEETRKLNRTDEVEAVAGEAIKILQEQLGLEIQNLQYLASEANGKVKVAWQVEDSEYHETFDFRVMQMSETRRTTGFFTCGQCHLHDKQAVLVTAFRRAALSVYHSEEFGYHYLEVYLTGKGFFNAVLRLSLYSPPTHPPHYTS